MNKATLHPDLDFYLDDFIKIRDAISGQKIIKYKKTKYLPMHEGMDDKSYDKYLKNAVFFNYTKRVLEALFAKIFRKRPVIEYSGTDEQFEDFLELVDGEKNMYDFLHEIVKEVFIGRCGCLMNFSDITQRVYIKKYRTEEILNWSLDDNGGLKQVVLFEQDEKLDENLERQFVYRYIYLFLNEEGQYSYSIHEETTGLRTGQLQLTETGTPVFNDQTLDYIPFYVKKHDENDIEISESISPLIDVVNVNLAHYRLYADYLRSLSFAVPTPIISGYDESVEDPDGVGTSFIAGPEMAWMFKGDVSVNYLEFNAAGIDPLKTALTNMEENIAKLGARVLSPEKRMAESAEAAMIHHLSESSILESISNNISNSMTQLVNDIIDIYNFNVQDFTIKLNTDFESEGVIKQRVDQLINLYEKGIIPLEDLLGVLKNAQYFENDRSIEDIIADLRNERETQQIETE